MTKVQADFMSSSIQLLTDVAQIGIDAQMVVAMRLAGMVGLWPTSHDESIRMVSEKQSAAEESMNAMMRTVWRGETPDRIMIEALKPIGRRTSANARRLSRAGRR